MVVDAVLAVGPLRDGLDAETATDIVWIVNDGTLYNSMVHVRGWSHERFQTWRAATLKSQLLGVLE